jgi:hypothetical protein
MDWNRYLKKNIYQDENCDDVFDHDDNEALVTGEYPWSSG